MLAIMAFMFLLYLQLGIIYRNISWLSMLCAFILGFIFYFCDPNEERYEVIRVSSIALIILIMGLAVVLLFFTTNPPLVSI